MRTEPRNNVTKKARRRLKCCEGESGSNVKPKECRLKIRRPKSLPVTGVDLFPSLTFCGCLGGVAPKGHSCPSAR